MLWDLRCIEPDVAWLAVRDSARLWLALQNEEHRVEEEEAETRVKLKANIKLFQDLLILIQV